MDHLLGVVIASSTWLALVINVNTAIFEGNGELLGPWRVCDHLGHGVLFSALGALEDGGGGVVGFDPADDVGAFGFVKWRPRVIIRVHMPTHNQNRIIYVNSTFARPNQAF